MKEFFDKINDFLTENKDPHVRFPKGVNMILEEKQSRWSFILEIENSTDTSRNIGILTGCVNTDRYQVIDASQQYVALGGSEVVETPYPQDTIINLKDDPRLINKVGGVSLDCVASQEHNNTTSEIAIPEQTIYKDATGQITVTSKDFFLNFFKEFLKISPVRVFELQISTDNVDLFSESLLLKELNPFVREEPEYINLEDYFLPDNSENVKIIIDSPFNLTAETLMSIPIPANTSATFGFRIGAYHSEGNAIKNKFKVGSFFKTLQLAAQKIDPKTRKQDQTDDNKAAEY